MMTKKLFFACLYASNLSQRFFSHVENISCFLRLNQYLAADKVPCLWTENSNSTGGESQTSNPSIFQSNALPTEPLSSIENHIERQQEFMT